MKLFEMKTGLAISAAGHAALLAWGLISFGARPLEAAHRDALPVDIISAEKFSEITKGQKDVKKVETPKPLVEKVADEPRTAEEATPKVAEKSEVKTAAAPPPEPEPPPKPEVKPEPRQEAKPEPEKPKPDPIAEALKKEEARKKSEARAKARAEAERKKKLEQQPKFDASQIAALLDKRNPQRLASTGREVNNSPSLGAPSALGMRIAQSELDAMRARLMQLWSPPAGVQNPQDLVVRVRIRLGRDGRLDGQPTVVGGARGPMSDVARESAMRAIYRGQPYDMLTPANYDIWKEVEITFDPREMFRG